MTRASNQQPRPEIHTVAVVAFDGVSPFHLSVPCIVFGNELAHLEKPLYRVIVCAETSGLIDTSSGFGIAVRHDLTVLAHADTVIVPAWHPSERPSHGLLEALRGAHARGCRLVGLCLGSFVLAEAGLLDGKRASTHWAWVEEFERMYARVELDHDALYVDDGNVFTSAGTAAALDCCLHLLRRDHGAELASQVARHLVVAPHRAGAQAQYIEKPLPAGEADQLADTLTWALEHLDEPHTLESLAQRAHMSVRTFTRHFRKQTGHTFTQWLLNHRLQRAQRLLETGRGTLDSIAEQAGFASTVAFRQHFTHAFSIPPGSYRKQFQARSLP